MPQRRPRRASRTDTKNPFTQHAKKNVVIACKDAKHMSGHVLKNMWHPWRYTPYMSTHPQTCLFAAFSACTFSTAVFLVIADLSIIPSMIFPSAETPLTYGAGLVTATTMGCNTLAWMREVHAIVKGDIEQIRNKFGQLESELSQHKKRDPRAPKERKPRQRPDHKL